VKDSCTGCHANPPRHDSGGAGTVTANTHVVVGDDGWELGHFAGLPGPWHTSKHGNGAGWPGEDAAPITCQTCHYETTDPANAGPSGFYYLDTRGSYRIDAPASDPFRLAEPAWQNGQCSTCHVPGGAVEGSGKVLPLRHVNGARDVVFDPRTTVPSASWFPTGAHAPSRPYWATNVSPGNVLVEPDVDAVLDGATWSLHLANATYDPGTKTCSNVACHLNESRPPYTPLQWGLTPAGWATCNNCHRF
jgi:predicted CxxxxCH...CXXCH cytochrome family protein